MEVLSDIRHRRLVVASVKRSGRNGKYAYLVIPLDLVRLLGIERGARFKVKITEDYVDYILAKNGDYSIYIGSRRAAEIRSLLDIRGEVFIEPIIKPATRGFRAY